MFLHVLAYAKNYVLAVAGTHYCQNSKMYMYM